MRVEQCWHTVKGGLRTRPIFHWTPHRICAHIALCVLALLVERIAEIRAGDTWRNIRDQIETIKVVEYERGGVHVQQTTEIRPAVAALLGRLNTYCERTTAWNRNCVPMPAVPDRTDILI